MAITCSKLTTQTLEQFVKYVNKKTPERHLTMKTPERRQ